MKKYALCLLLCISSLWTTSTEGKGYMQTRGSNVRIIGGDTANVGQFPSAAAIYVTTETSTTFCAGSLLNEWFVLTAAHCIAGAVIVRVQLGSTRLDGTDANRITLATSNLYIHPSFNPDTLEHDVGLVKFHMAITFTEYIKPIYLPTTHLIDSMTATALGWGQTSDENSGLSNELKYVEVTTISNQECQLSYANTVIFDTMVCVAGNYNEGTCRGDSGSPLMITLNHHHWHVGISTFISTNGCESIDPSGYTRTYPHVDWIKNVTGIA